MTPITPATINANMAELERLRQVVESAKTRVMCAKQARQTEGYELSLSAAMHDRNAALIAWNNALHITRLEALLWLKKVGIEDAVAFGKLIA